MDAYSSIMTLDGHSSCKMEERRSGFLVAVRSVLSLDVTKFPTSIALSGLSGIIPQGLLVVAPLLLLGSNTPIGVISCIERHLMVVLVPTSCRSSGTIVFVHGRTQLLDCRFSWRNFPLVSCLAVWMV